MSIKGWWSRVKKTDQFNDNLDRIYKRGKYAVVCKSCGSFGTLEEIRRKYPRAISCCPERDTGDKFIAKLPCSHPGCFGHVTHPCEGCGRIWKQVPLP